MQRNRNLFISSIVVLASFIFDFETCFSFEIGTKNRSLNAYLSNLAEEWLDLMFYRISRYDNLVSNERVKFWVQP